MSTSAILPGVIAFLLLGCPARAQLPDAIKSRTAAARSEVTKGVTAATMERAAPNRGTFTIKAAPEVTKQLKLLDANLKEVVTRVRDGELKAEIDPHGGYILTPPPPGRKPLSQDGAEFPARYVTFSPTGATNLGGLFLRPAVVPLTWNQAAMAYATDLFVGYEFEDGREITLPAPKTVTFFTEGANARIQADRVTVTKSGGAGYQRVTLTTGQHDQETHFTARVSAADELKSSVSVRREPGGLRLYLPSTELPAFGVGSAVLTVSLLARDGEPLGAPEPLDVRFSSRRLRLPPTVTLNTGANAAAAEVRSFGYGLDEIVAQSGGLRVTLPVRLIFPVAATVAAILGGALGGSARFLRNKRRGSGLLARRAIEGMLVGLILVGAVWTGLVSVDVSTGILGTPFGAFVLGALSGYLGCVVLDRVAKKTFGGLKAEA